MSDNTTLIIAGGGNRGGQQATHIQHGQDAIIEESDTNTGQRKWWP